MKSTLVKSAPIRVRSAVGRTVFIIFLAVCSFVSGSGFSQSQPASYKTIHVKFKEEFVPNHTGRSTRSGMRAMDLVSEKYAAASMERIYPDAGKFEKAHRTYGLHLWYEIKFPQGADTTRAIIEYKNLDYFEKVEPCREYTAGWDRNEDAIEIPSTSILTGRTNDPLYKDQWHYKNTGQTGGTPGADINLEKGWRIETGSSNVIVAVIDGGVDLIHPDLKDAMWTNIDEIPGNGIDDDHNGYRDDIHGYNFGDGESTIYPDVHGTHVAGTIGAVSNNGIGVAGIAGGSGTANGVRIMSLAAFGQFNNARFESAMVYAADNGAVISQNSWGGGSTAIEAAIGYFIERAGLDNSNANFDAKIQTGPMAGGIVIFAAGNDNTSDALSGYPGSFPRVMAVASLNHNDIKAGTSNYGGWVDIAAPGDQVLSTKPGSQYGLLSGTSMACPHVSGVAALLISHLQQPGLKPSEIRNRILQSAKSVDNKNPNYIGMLGSGKINAFSMFGKRDLIPPGAITDLHAASVRSTSATLQWTAPPESGTEGGLVEKYEIRMSGNPINEANFSNATLVSPPNPAIPGQPQTITLSGLAAQKSYYIAIKSTDVFYLTSALSNVATFSTTQFGIVQVGTQELAEVLPSGKTITHEVELTNIGGDILQLELDKSPEGLEWVTFNPNTMTLIPGETKKVSVTFNTTDMLSGEYEGWILLHQVNTPFAANFIHPTVTVTARTGLGIKPVIDFGSCLANLSSDSTITIRNLNATNLTLNSIESSNSHVSVSINSLTLSPGEEYPLTISVNGPEAELIDATVTFTTDDPGFETVDIRVRANLITNPEITVSPASINTTLSLSETKTVNVLITNTGPDPFQWNSNYPETPLPSAGLNKFVQKASSPVELTALSYDPDGGFLYGKALFTAAFYRYNFSANNWSSVASGPTTIFGQAAYLNGKIYHTGQNLEIYSIGSNTWASVSYPIAVQCQSITTNGEYLYLAFGKVLYRYDPVENIWLELITFTGGYSNSIGALSYWNGIIYASENSSDGIAGDGNTPLFIYTIQTNTWYRSVNLNGKVGSCSAIDPVSEKFFTHVGSQLSVRNLRESTEVQRVKPFSATNGSMVYVDKAGFTGIYSVHGSTSFFRYETAPVPVGWITVSPEAGEIPAGASQNLTIKIGSPNLAPGIHTDEIKIFTEDLRIEIERIPVQVIVSDAPEISLSKNSANAGQVAIGNSRLSSLQIRNTGTSPLLISNVTIDNPNFLLAVTSYTIQVGEEITVAPQLKPLTTGELTGTFTFYNNDPDEPSVEFKLTGEGVATSIAEVTPLPVFANLLSGDKILQNIQMSNGGGSEFLGVLINHEGNWLTAPYGASLLSSGGMLTIPITLDASNKSAGVYEGKVILYYRDETLSYAVDIDIPITMTVTDAPGIRANKESLNFGNRYISSSYDTIITITNNGALPLSITNIATDNSAFTIKTTAPLDLAPGEHVDAIVNFNPEATGSYNGNVTFTSNDPNDGTYVISLSGFGVTLPNFTSDITEIHESVLTDMSKTQTFMISNSGGSNLMWQLGLGTEESGGDFTVRMNSSQYAITSLVINPATGLVYAQSPRTNNLYEYNPASNQWTTVADNAPGINTITHAGAVVMDSKMYCFFDQNPSQLYVYEILLKEWSTTPNQLGLTPTAITTNGNLIYLAAGNALKTFNPATGVWVILPPAPLDLNGIGGMQYFNGKIYAHAADGLGFAAYAIAAQTWEVLPDAPNTMTESAVDPELQRYYAVGKDGHSLYEYNFSANLWTVINIPLFNITNGKIVYVSTPSVKGIYFTQGTLGYGFGMYQAASVNLDWLKISPLSGILESSGSQQIKLNFNAHNLNTGSYETMLKITSNDPDEPLREIPVTFEVTNPGAVIKVPELLTGSLARLASYTTTLKIENTGGAPLEWNLAANLLPVGLTVSNSSGTIAAAGFENITVTYVPGFFSPRVFEYALEINSSDRFTPIVSTQLKFIVTTALNAAPVVEQPFDDLSVTVGTPPLELLIPSGAFSDPDGDDIQYSVISSNNQVAALSLIDNKLKIFLFNPGSSKITVTGMDKLEASVSTDFDVTINEVVTAVEDEIEKTLSVYPNPFARDISVRYTTDKPTQAAIILFDITGKIVWQSTGYAEIQGVNEVMVDGNQLPSGIYHARLMRKENPIVTVRLMKR